jgi:hypothetical protein
MPLWMEWFHCLQDLRPACSRTKTFLWMSLALVGLSIRSDLAGVTSFVRAAGLAPHAYRRLLHLFHTPALSLALLTSLWVRLALKLFSPLEAGGRLVCVADGIKVPKEGKKMPAVKRLHQESGDNSKPEFIFGHSFQAVGLLVRSALGKIACVPLASRIHEGVVFSPRDRRTLLDKLVELLRSLLPDLLSPVLLLVDAFYASRKVIRPLLQGNHHIITRLRSNAVAWRPAPKPKERRRGRPRLYGKKIHLRDLWKEEHRFTTAPSPILGESGVRLRYLSLDLLWRPIGRLARFVLVHHPRRGCILLLCTDLSLEPLQILLLYSYRFQIEVSFKQALRTLGTYAYHFWMEAMEPLRRRSGNQFLHRKSENYRRLVRRKLDAYHRYVQLGCVAQGLLQHLSLNLRKKVWASFGSWMRTMRPALPPSEAVVAQALRNSLPEFLLAAPDTHTLKKFLLANADPERCPALELVG